MNGIIIDAQNFEGLVFFGAGRTLGDELHHKLHLRSQELGCEHAEESYQGELPTVFEIISPTLKLRV